MSLYALYVVAINTLLSTSLFDRLVNQDPETIRIRYTRGWSLLPGRVHAEGLSIRSSDSNVEWRLSLDEVTFDVSVLALTQQRFEVTRARGRGVRLRARQKLDAWPDTAEQVSTLPPIEGYPAFSVRPAGPPSLERWDDSKYALWTVQLDDVIAEDVREVWIDDGRFEGEARVAGRFYLKPIRAVEVGPARVEIRGGRVTLGRSLVLAKDVAGAADVRLDRFDPRFVGGSVLRWLTLRTELRATFADPATLPFAMPAGAYVSGEVAAPRVDLRIDRGVVASGTRVELGAKRVVVSKANVVGTAALGVAVEVTNDGDGDRLRAEVGALDLALVRADAAGVLRAPRAVVTADARRLDLADAPFGDAHATLRLTDADLVDAAVLDPYVPPAAPVAILGGSARASATLELFAADRHASGSVELHAKELDVRLAEIRTRGSFGVLASFGAYRWEQRLVEDARLSLVVTNAALSAARAPTKPKVTADTLRLDARSAAVDLDDPLRSLEASFELPDASIVDVHLLDGFPRAGMEGAPGRSRFALDGRVTIEDHLARGTLHARSRELGLVLGDVHVRAAVEAHARVHDVRWERGDLAIDEASIVASGVAITRGAAPLGTVERIAVRVESPHFDFGAPLGGVDARLVIAGAEIRDARALDALLLPAGGAVRIESGEARASCDVRVSASKRTSSGELAIEIARGGIAVRETRLAGDFGLRATVGGFDPATSTFDVSGSRMTMREIAVVRAAAETTRWRGDLVFQKALVRLRGEPGLDAVVRLDADDARPLLGVLLRDSVPKLLVGLAEMPRLAAYARLRFAPHALVLSDVSATGGDVALRGAFALYDDDRRGAFVVEKGPFSVGLRLGNDGTTPRFFNLDAWLGAQQRNVAAKAKGPLLPVDERERAR
ncbi:MAG: hypothetical protein KF764_34090 [Labilithrix sp.]|nr:hypothetical protein [Labilithrix sp.]